MWCLKKGQIVEKIDSLQKKKYQKIKDIKIQINYRKLKKVISNNKITTTTTYNYVKIGLSKNVERVINKCK